MRGPHGGSAWVPGGSAMGSAPFLRGFRGGSCGFRAVPWEVPHGVPHVKILLQKLVSLVGIEAGRWEVRFPEKMGSVRVSSLL